MSIDWEELLGAEGEDLDDAYDEALADAEWWLEGHDDCESSRNFGRRQSGYSE